jgi:hypothetical protein
VTHIPFSAWHEWHSVKRSLLKKEHVMASE